MMWFMGALRCCDASVFVVRGILLIILVLEIDDT